MAKMGAGKEEWLNNADTKAMTVLAETMLKALPDILREDVPATDIMFPHSSMELVEGIYKHNQVADYFNSALSDTLTAYVKENISKHSKPRSAYWKSERAQAAQAQAYLKSLGRIKTI